MAFQACATCASVFDDLPKPGAEKPLSPGRFLSCCGRSICSRCLSRNRRYETYCPYCQISSGPSLLPQGLRDPPTYSALSGATSPPTAHADEKPPAYTPHREQIRESEKAPFEEAVEDVLHFVKPNDTMRSLGLAYGVPLPVLRRTNNIFSDHLLQGRKTVLVPSQYYKGGVSLSPRPVQGEEEEIKKNRIRRWMVACKVPEYEVALLYLEQNEWDLAAAVAASKEDEIWELEHPVDTSSKARAGKSPKERGMRRFVGTSSSVGGG